MTDCTLNNSLFRPFRHRPSHRPRFHLQSVPTARGYPRTIAKHHVLVPVPARSYQYLEPMSYLPRGVAYCSGPGRALDRTYKY